jgi:hypothetical protein
MSDHELTVKTHDASDRANVKCSCGWWIAGSDKKQIERIGSAHPHAEALVAELRRQL